jgi:hypothetical protein
MVEYSSTPYLLFMAGEYIAIFLMCALISLLFFGGWLSPIPGLPDGALWMVLKQGIESEEHRHAGSPIRTYDFDFRYCTTLRRVAPRRVVRFATR